MRTSTSRYGLTREDQQVALWHFRTWGSEFLGWFPSHGSISEIEHAVEEHSTKCEEREPSPTEDSEVKRSGA